MTVKPVTRYTGTGPALRRILALALAAILCVGFSVSAAAESPEPVDVDLILAQNAAVAFSLKGPDGKLLKPRKAEEMKGRGEPDVVGEEPDYRGIVGYMALQTSWEVSRFNTFTQTPWLLPVYENTGEKWKVVDTIKHKTPVLVVEQRIREQKGHKFAGYLKVVRLDTHHMIWVDVKQFVTVPYWTMDLEKAVQYGYVIAVYRNNSRYEPMDNKKHRGTLPDGLRVLMCDTKTARYFSKEPAHNPLLGIVFRSKEEKDAYYRTFLFFNRDDLSMVY